MADKGVPDRNRAATMSGTPLAGASGAPFNYAERRALDFVRGA
jgi:hypothetical protein